VALQFFFFLMPIFYPPPLEPRLLDEVRTAVPSASWLEDASLDGSGRLMAVSLKLPDSSSAGKVSSTAGGEGSGGILHQLAVLSDLDFSKVSFFFFFCRTKKKKKKKSVRGCFGCFFFFFSPG
jgi:hypothetical protein